ncbi:GGDEF domain-containing phosphodiesterase [Roseobacter sp.]|uniref:putative bifunctional diguanylate cyclase/phosphodiesterase n=1 Tax=Roseobacter sp. TaxID=1907202 RepID=UPI0025FA1716|nr:GGDEF domain-containing phosphodiesterase [Roseobacter sp.]
MANSTAQRLLDLRGRIAAFMIKPVMLALLPAALLGGYWIGGEATLMGAALLFPAVYMLLGGANALTARSIAKPATRGLIRREDYRTIVGQSFVQARDLGQMSALFAIEIDESDVLVDRYGQSATTELFDKISSRLACVLRDNDVIAQTSDFRFEICLAPVRHLDLERCIQIAGRLQSAVEEPVSVEGSAIYVTACVGFCQSARMLRRDAETWNEAADLALAEAKSNGPNAIRAFSADLRRQSETRAGLREEVTLALEKGEIRAWFQPQISTDTGLVSGFEALARWEHPQRGMIPPSEFLPAIEQAGLLERLAEVMMYHAFTALRAWDTNGVSVPRVGVNFAGPELNNPGLVEKVKWELDRFNLSPDRLAVEVLETVVARAPDDMVTRNISSLNALGCQIDLDDFGTGHASIASIRRFAVSRIKIDRSFVIKSDKDPEQQRMVSAILTMAERLGVETLAEGVESAGEHALLAQLGCDHVQGFGIGKPMPFDQTLEWISAHTAKLGDAPRILGNRSG